MTEEKPRFYFDKGRPMIYSKFVKLSDDVIRLCPRGTIYPFNWAPGMTIPKGWKVDRYLTRVFRKDCEGWRVPKPLRLYVLMKL